MDKNSLSLYSIYAIFQKILNQWKTPEISLNGIAHLRSPSPVSPEHEIFILFKYDFLINKGLKLRYHC